MSLLQYTSKEMVSSTELIRKSKKVFDSIQNNQIEKAIILRDGKPSFMLLDFEKYEEIISEYIQLKEEKNKKQKIYEENSKKNENKASIEEIGAEELQSALEKIEDLQLEDRKNANLDVEKKDEALKEFWD